MSDNTQKQINPLIYIIVLITAFFIISKGTTTYANYNMMKKALDKVEFLEQNNASNTEICDAVDWALSVSKQIQNQEKYKILVDKNSLLKC